MSAPPRGISGRWFTIGFGILLAIGVVAGFLIVVRFQKIMTALDSVRHLWPDAAIVLEGRYREIDNMVSKLHANDSGKDEAELRAWQQSWAEFKTSTQYDVQARTIGRLESLADELVPERDGNFSTKDFSPSLRDFLQADRSLRSLQADGIGWLCKQLFQMNIPDQIYSLLE